MINRRGRCQLVSVYGRSPEAAAAVITIDASRANAAPSSKVTPSQTGIRKHAPIDALIDFGENASAEFWETITPAMPEASAVLSTAPRFAGLFISCRYKTSGRDEESLFS